MPPTTGNSFDALADTDDPPLLANNGALFKAIRTAQPDVAAVLIQQDRMVRAIPAQVATQVVTQMATALAPLDSQVATQVATQMATALAPLASFVDLVKAMNSLLFELKDFKGQLGDLRLDVNNLKWCHTNLNSVLLKQDSLLTGCKASNNRLVTSLRMDINDPCSKFPELCRELIDSTVGLATSIKEIEAILQGFQAQVAAAPPVDQGADTPVPPPLPGGSVDPPPMLGHARTTRFQFPNGLMPTFRGAAFFTPGNCSH